VAKEVSHPSSEGRDRMNQPYNTTTKKCILAGRQAALRFAYTPYVMNTYMDT
jgi:hypothetical protein